MRSGRSSLRSRSVRSVFCRHGRPTTQCNRAQHFNTEWCVSVHHSTAQPFAPYIAIAALSITIDRSP
eukprot:1292721-Pyramimonas_sp.AAC.1